MMNLVLALHNKQIQHTHRPPPPKKKKTKKRVPYAWAKISIEIYFILFYFMLFLVGFCFFLEVKSE
jgi:hypothetical protein